MGFLDTVDKTKSNAVYKVGKDLQKGSYFVYTKDDSGMINLLESGFGDTKIAIKYIKENLETGSNKKFTIKKPVVVKSEQESLQEHVNSILDGDSSPGSYSFIQPVQTNDAVSFDDSNMMPVQESYTPPDPSGMPTARYEGLDRVKPVNRVIEDHADQLL